MTDWMIALFLMGNLLALVGFAAIVVLALETI